MSKKHHWLDFAEYASLVSLGIGSVASFATAQLLYTSAPLSLLVLLNLTNRNRVDQEEKRERAIAVKDLDQRMSKQLELLHHQVQSMPTPEAMGSLKKSMLVKNRELAESLSAELKSVQRDILQRVTYTERQHLGGLRDDFNELKLQYTHLCDGMAQVTSKLQNLSSSARVDELERAMIQLRAETSLFQTNLQNLADQTKPTLTSLQDQISHLNRQFQKLPPPFDSSALRQEVAELIRVVADLVPKREWTTLVTEMQALHQQQESQSQAEETLRRNLYNIHQQLQSRPTKSNLTALQNQINHLNRQLQKLPPPFDPSSLKLELAKLVKVVSELVPRRDFSSLVAQVKALQQQQEFQNNVEQTLRDELQTLNHQLQQLISEPEAVAQASHPPRESASPQQQEFQARLEKMLHQELAQINDQLQMLPSTPDLQAQIETTLQQEIQEINQQLRMFPAGPQYEFVLDFKSVTRKAVEPKVATSRMVLEEALRTTQQRLIVILPWSSQCYLDDALMYQLEAFLQQGRRLDLGWCHQADRKADRFLSAINQRWQISPLQQGDLQDTLQKLLYLKRAYPNCLQFKILGTQENFLISDERFAVLGIDDAITAGTVFHDTELKLRSTDPEMVQQLIERFEHPILNPEDVMALLNRAATRYDLGDKFGSLGDFEQVVAANPGDAIALNFRGLVRSELEDREGAIADFTQAIQSDPQHIAAYCNRGYLRSEMGDSLAAIQDYSAALEVQPSAAIAYFLRGMASQKIGELEAAVSDYSAAIRFVPDAPAAYYYRGLTRPKIGDYAGAISDLETALDLFTERGSDANARKVFTHLQKLRKTLAVTDLLNSPMPGVMQAASARRNGSHTSFSVSEAAESSSGMGGLPVNTETLGDFCDRFSA